MFELMDTTRDRAIIQIIGFGEKGQALCHYIENKGVEGVEYFIENEIQQSSVTSISTSSNLALAITVEQGSSHQAVADSDLNFYLIDESYLSEHLDEIQKYVDQTCLNCLVILNHNSTVDLGSKEVAEVLAQMDSFLPLPFSPYQDNEVPYLIDQNEMAYRFVQGISEIITRPGLICADFADVRTVILEMGMTVMGTHSATGENRAVNAIGSVISSPVFKDGILSEARAILVNMTGGMDTSISEFEEVGNSIKAIVTDNATVVVAAPIDPDMNGEMRVTVIATGISSSSNIRKVDEPTINISSIIEFAPDDSSEDEDYKDSDIPAFLRPKKD